MALKRFILTLFFCDFLLPSRSSSNSLAGYQSPGGCHCPSFCLAAPCSPQGWEFLGKARPTLTLSLLACCSLSLEHSFPLLRAGSVHRQTPGKLRESPTLASNNLLNMKKRLGVPYLLPHRSLVVCVALGLRHLPHLDPGTIPG